MILKYKLMIFFRSLAVSLGVFALLGEIGYYYVFPQQKEARVKEEKVPYFQTPQNAGILFDFSGDTAFVYLNFDSECVNVLIDDSENYPNYGYSQDFKIEGDYELLGGIVDCVGGIDLDLNGEPLTYTGVQIAEFLSNNITTSEFKAELVRAIFVSISQRDFLREDMLYIIENSNTNLTVPDCYYWQENIKKISKTVRVIN